MERKNSWISYDAYQLQELENLCREYREFLDNGKTERECVREAIRIAETAGYRELGKIITEGEKLYPGAKVYQDCMGKAIALFRIGTKPLDQGMAILGAHIDSPRLDVKQNPLYEDNGQVYLDTHYYGGVKKYQWVTLPMAIHGVFVKKDGAVVNVNIGDNEGDPVFTITDLLIHLAAEQLEKNGARVVAGEDLDLLFGSMPLKDEDKEAVKKNILFLLAENYGITEEDFLSAELEIVPAGKARDCGLDRSMILGYGQDDRVCAFTSLKALLDSTDCERTSCCFLCDKEEIGSVGATGAQSRFFENTVAELLNCCGEFSELTLRRCLANSLMLSSDVSAGYDPLYAAAFEKKSAAYLGRGLCFNKFTGARGKSGANDANPEYFARIRKILDDEQISYQMSELGRVDLGGGGTIAYIFSLFGMEVIDSGVAVLSMHAPWEVTSKADIYEAKKGYMAFLKQI